MFYAHCFSASIYFEWTSSTGPVSSTYYLEVNMDELTSSHDFCRVMLGHSFIGTMNWIFAQLRISFILRLFMFCFITNSDQTLDM